MNLIAHPLVSIVVPLFNAENYIEKTILSILNQSYTLIECIVIDDGSTDNSFEVIKKFSDRIRIFRQSNAGQAAALNAGFSHCTGEFITYLSADDTIDEHCVKHLVNAINNYKFSSELPLVVFPLYRTIDSKDNLINPSCAQFEGTDFMISHFQCQIGPCALFDRSLFLKLGGWDSTFRQIPDFVFWVKLIPHACFIQIDDVLSSFRVHENSQTFSQPSVDKADESVKLVELLRNKESFCSKSSFLSFSCSAYIFSSCLHIRAQRYHVGLRRFFKALMISPFRAIAPSSLRKLISSLKASFTYF